MFRIIAAFLLLVGLSCGGPTPAPPRHLPFNEAQEIVPFPIQVPTFIPEGYELDEEAYILEGRPFGWEVKGVSYSLSQGKPQQEGNIHVRQFMAEGTFPLGRVLQDDIVTYEVIDIRGFDAEVREAEMGDGWRVAVEWEAEHEGKRLFLSVNSGVSRDDTLELVKSMEPLNVSR